MQDIKSICKSKPFYKPVQTEIIVTTTNVRYQGINLTKDMVLTTTTWHHLVNMRVPSHPATVLLGMHLRNSCVSGEMDEVILRNTGIETTQMSINSRMNKLWYTTHESSENDQLYSET